MDKTPPDPTEGHTLTKYLPWTVALALIAYPLSAGPALRLAHNGYLPVGSTTAFYRPLIEICDHYKPLGQAFFWYTGTYLSRAF